MAITVLLATSTRWISTARLAMALVETGCAVHALCRAGHPLLLTSVPVKHYRYRDLQPERYLERAIAESKPDLLVACDEETFRLAHRLYRLAAANKDVTLCTLLERSLGSPAGYEADLSRFGLMEMARREGIGVPETAAVRAVEDLAEIGDRLGWPLVLKTDGSFGGNGVRVAEDVGQALGLWRLLRGPAGMARTVHRVLTNRRLSPLYTMLRRDRLAVIAQSMIVGKEATLAVACWKGKVLASHCMEIVKTWSVRGPSSVLRVIESGEMLAAAETLVRGLGLSGFCGFDFMVDERTGSALLIEMNSRPTQTCHLALGTGKDLVTSLVRAIHRDLGLLTKPEWRLAVAEPGFVALFPQELQRDANSDWIRTGFHDVPVGEPRLIRFALTQPGLDWYSRLTRRVLAVTR